MSNKGIAVALLIILLLRLSFTGIMGLMPQDAYYYFYAEHPALSYYDHPPAIAWLLKLFSIFLGKKVFVIKLADTITTLLSVFFFYRLSRHFLSKHGTQKALLLLFPTLMITILSLVSTPDVPLLLFWTLTLLSLRHALFSGIAFEGKIAGASNEKATLYHVIFNNPKIAWVWAGFMMGMAFNSKYTAVFLPLGLLLFLTFSKTHRRWLATPWPWIAFVVMAIVSSPVIIWNLQHNMASFRFQSSGRASGIEIRPLDVLGVIGHQAGILMPVLFFGLVWVLYKFIRKYRLRIATIPADQLFLLCFFLPLFIGFFIISPIYWIKLNWMMPAYISGVIWVSVYFSRKFIRWQIIIALIVHVAMAVELLYYPVHVNSDDVWVGWGRMARTVKALKTQYPSDFVFSADDYKTSAVLNFYFDELVYGQNILGRKALQFDYIGTDLNTLAGRNALFVNSRIGDITDERAFADTLRKFFTEVQPLTPVISRKNGKIVREFLVFRCLDYHPQGVK